MRALVLSNMRPSPSHPGRGVFVRDQVAALRRIAGLEVELFEFSPGPASLAATMATLRARYRRTSFDVVHAHFGITAWAALAVPGDRRMVTLHGTDLRHPRTRRLTLAAARRMDLVATVSASLATELPDLAVPRAVLPCGVELDRFNPIPRTVARTALGLDPDEACLLFPADPRRAVKRFERATAVAGDVQLLTLGEIDPKQVSLAINAANAVLVPSEAEGFGLAVLEALACGVPVIATRVGIHPLALDGIEGTLCSDFDVALWRAAVEPHLLDADPRVDGRARAELFSAERMAERVAAAWRFARTTD